MKKSYIDLSKVSENLAQEMLGIAKLKEFKKSIYDSTRLLKQANYSKREALDYMYGLTFQQGLIPYFALVTRWTKQAWREI